MAIIDLEKELLEKAEAALKKAQEVLDKTEKITTDVIKKASDKISELEGKARVVINNYSANQPRKVQITVKRLHPNAKLPAYQHVGGRGDMAADVYAIEDHDLVPGEFYKCPTGLIMQPPEGYGFKIRERSSQWFKVQTMVGAGLGDPGYLGEYFIGLKNMGDSVYHIKTGDRIAQVQVIERIEGEFSDGNPIDTTRGEGGLGSTGK